MNYKHCQYYLIHELYHCNDNISYRPFRMSNFLSFSVFCNICTQTLTILRLTGLSGTAQVSQYQKKHSPTHIYHCHQSSLICFLHLLQSTASSLFNLHAYSLFPQSLSKFSLVYLLAWHPQLHTPYISSSNHCLLFAVHAHTITTCFAVVVRLCHLILVSLPTLYLELYLVAYRHTSI